MSAHPPPVPPANRSPKGPGEPGDNTATTDPKLQPSRANPDQIGKTGDVKQNTTHPGYQQDR